MGKNFYTYGCDYTKYKFHRQVTSMTLQLVTNPSKDQKKIVGDTCMVRAGNFGRKLQASNFGQSIS